MIRRPPRSTLSSSSAASDVYKRQGINAEYGGFRFPSHGVLSDCLMSSVLVHVKVVGAKGGIRDLEFDKLAFTTSHEQIKQLCMDRLNDASLTVSMLRLFCMGKELAGGKETKPGHGPVARLGDAIHPATKDMVIKNHLVIHLQVNTSAPPKQAAGAPGNQLDKNNSCPCCIL
eukprot:TRINITY_DN313_c0_g1_i5.p1 TRINITY_DN313_c0_g1~~TRINITY_DN313_c0_g1_i5.p1  ORF type:complete len:173 (+),score=42.60 TRINITY_DN313_c0_g1_i5:103-621(+)